MYLTINLIDNIIGISLITATVLLIILGIVAQRQTAPSEGLKKTYKWLTYYVNINLWILLIFLIGAVIGVLLLFASGT